jgi:uncharacterized protein (TIGR02145 family)
MLYFYCRLCFVFGSTTACSVAHGFVEGSRAQPSDEISWACPEILFFAVDSLTGCTNPLACNWNPIATIENGTCYYTSDCFGCDGTFWGPIACPAMICELDYDLLVCGDPNACNYVSCVAGTCCCPGCFGLCIYPPDGNSCEEYAAAMEQQGCTYPSACNYDATAIEDDGSCVFVNQPCEACAFNGPGWHIDVLNGEFTGTFNQNPGIVCIVDVNINGVCDCDETSGCTEPVACNYSATATLEDGSCTFPMSERNCAGDCIQDSDDDDVCDADEVVGCMNEEAVNFNPLATEAGLCFILEDLLGTACAAQLAALTSQIAAGSFCGEGTLWSPMHQQCIPVPECVGDLSGDDIVGTTDLLSILSVYGLICPTSGCMLPLASNYNPGAMVEDFSCVVLGCSNPFALNYLPGSNTINDTECQIGDFSHDGPCRGDSVWNYNAYDYPLVELGGACWFRENLRTVAFQNGEPLTYVPAEEAWLNPQHAAVTPAGGSVWVANSFGNVYTWHAVQDERGLCPSGWHPADSTDWTNAIMAAGGALTAGLGMKVPGNRPGGTGPWISDNEGATNFTGFSALPSGYRLPSGAYGGVYATAQFWGAESISTNNARSYYVNKSFAHITTTQNSKSLGLAVRCVRDPLIEGCMDPTACNYNLHAQLENGGCLYPSNDCEYCSGSSDGTGTILSFDYDSDGCCMVNEIDGCSDPSACNYNPEPCIDNNGSCYYVFSGYDCFGNCIGDPDGDGICGGSVSGCTNSAAWNYNPLATSDDGSCLFDFFGCCSTCNPNWPACLDFDGVCFEDCMMGCTHAAACNYNPSATDEDGSCLFPVLCEYCVGGAIVNADPDGDGVCDEDE